MNFCTHRSLFRQCVYGVCIRTYIRAADAAKTTCMHAVQMQQIYKYTYIVPLTPCKHGAFELQSINRSILSYILFLPSSLQWHLSTLNQIRPVNDWINCERHPKTTSRSYTWQNWTTYSSGLDVTHFINLCTPHNQLWLCDLVCVSSSCLCQ